MCSIFKPEFYIDSFCVNMRICFNMKGVDHVSNNNYFSVARRHYVKPPACSHFQFYSSYFPCGLSLPFITKISVARVLTWTYKDFLCNYFKLTIHKYVQNLQTSRTHRIVTTMHLWHFVLYFDIGTFKWYFTPTIFTVRYRLCFVLVVSFCLWPLSLTTEVSAGAALSHSGMNSQRPIIKISWTSAFLRTLIVRLNINRSILTGHTYICMKTFIIVLIDGTLLFTVLIGYFIRLC